MKTNNISKKEYKNFSKLDIGKNLMNNEAEMFIINKRANWNRQKYILKKLYNNEGDYFGNKLFTVNALIDRKDEINIKQLIIPSELAIYKNKIIGFYLPYIDNINFNYMINTFSISNEQKLAMFKEIGNILEKLKKLRNNPRFSDFYLNDIHEDNFIYNKETKEINVVDLDSCSISGNKPFASRYLTPCSPVSNFPYKYKQNSDTRFTGFIIPDENSDLFCYNVMILNYLFGDKITSLSIDDFYIYLNYLRSLKINNEILDVFSKLYTNSDNVSALDYLDMLDVDKDTLMKCKKGVFNWRRGN